MKISIEGATDTALERRRECVCVSEREREREQLFITPAPSGSQIKQKMMQICDHKLIFLLLIMSGKSLFCVSKASPVLNQVRVCSELSFSLLCF